MNGTGLWVLGQAEGGQGINWWPEADPRAAILVLLVVLAFLLGLVLWDTLRRMMEERRQTRRLLEEVSACGLDEGERLLLADIVTEYEIRRPSALLDSVKVFDQYAQRDIVRILGEKTTWSQKQERLKRFESIRRKILAAHDQDPLRLAALRPAARAAPGVAEN